MNMFVCQSLLKERMRPPTGGLREAFKESLGGGGVSTPSPAVVGSKTIPGASEVRFPLPEENDWLLLSGRERMRLKVSTSSAYWEGMSDRATSL